MREKVSPPGSFKLLFYLVLSGIIWPVTLASQVRINEIMASNATVHADLDFGNYSDWIEIYNNSDLELDLTGYFLSDDDANPTMWSFQTGTLIPARGFILVYADGTGFGMHTNFKLAKEGEPLLLVGPLATVIDSFSYPSQLTDISYGRRGDNPEVLGYFTSPTPGEINGNEVLTGIASRPVFSLQSGFYTGPQLLEITAASPGATIYFTLDGTLPADSSTLYTGPVDIGLTSVVRAITVEDGKLTGPAITQSYFIDEPQNLPVVSLVTDPDHLFSDETGIYVEGTAGVEGYCTSVPHNVNQDWERPVNIELIEKDGTIGLNQVAGVKIFGGCSRVRYPQKSLALYARKEYDQASFNYRLFPDKPNEQYETFILRASADDQPFTLFRDPLTQMVVKDVIDVDVQAYRPVVVYINGEYWGIHNLREKINENYPEDNYSVNSDSVDVLRDNPENSWEVVAGNPDHYLAMMDYLRQNDVSQDVHYEYMKSQMEMDEYINYQVIQIFFGGRDWPGNNIKFWRSHEAPHNRWRWVLFDLDHMFKEYFSDIMEEATEVDCGCDWPNPPWSTYLFRRLLENEEFKHEFIQRFDIYATTYFSRERLHEFLNKLQAELAPEIPRHIERWGGQKTNLPDNTWVAPVFNSVAQWEANVQVMRDFIDTRHEMALKHLNDYFGTTGFAGLDAYSEPAGSGTIKIGGTLVEDPSFKGEFIRGENLTVALVEQPGYQFSHWLLNRYNTLDTALIIQGDLWKYLISREMPGSNWTALGYDDSLWENGLAQLGYGDGDEATVVDFGGDPANKFITTWFRKTFIIPDSSLNRRYTLNLLRDDGARVFINGLEMVRDNMQRWWVASDATSEAPVDGLQESTWFTFGLNPGLFRNGENVVAVEIHQTTPTSSDLSFDLELVVHQNQPGTDEIILENQLQLELLDDTKLTAVMVSDTTQIEQVFINEVMASNDAGLTDELGEYEDWIELYNAGGEAVDLAGLFLSDELPATAPWRFPLDKPGVTTIGPLGYMVIFADNQLDQGPLHANFKLSKNGEVVALMQKIGNDTVVVDQMIFGAQAKNVSYGRTPDGSTVLDFMLQPSPGASNIMSTVDDHSMIEPQGEVMIYPVPTHGPLFVKFDETLAEKDLPVEISVYSMTGSKVSSTLHHSASLIQLSLEEQPQGLYILRITAGEQRFVRRIVIY